MGTKLIGLQSPNRQTVRYRADRVIRAVVERGGDEDAASDGIVEVYFEGDN
jgi:hypothetical protein